MPDKWKYNLSLNGAYALMCSPMGIALYSLAEAMAYYEMVKICHDFVESYMDAHPETVLSRLTYFTILKKASPEYYQKVSEWSLENKRRSEEYFIKVKGWSIVYGGIDESAS